MAKNIEINVKTNDGYETLYPENQCLKLSGGTVTGNLIVNGNTTVNGSLILPNSPINGTDASNKSYVDGRYTAGNGININDGVVSVNTTNLNDSLGSMGWTNCGNFLAKYSSKTTSVIITVPYFKVYKAIWNITSRWDNKWNTEEFVKPEVSVENFFYFYDTYDDDGNLESTNYSEFTLRCADIGVDGTSSEGKFEWSEWGTLKYTSKTNSTVTFTYSNSLDYSYYTETACFTIFGRNVPINRS